MQHGYQAPYGYSTPAPPPPPAYPPPPPPPGPPPAQSPTIPLAPDSPTSTRPHASPAHPAWIPHGTSDSAATSFASAPAAPLLGPPRARQRERTAALPPRDDEGVWTHLSDTLMSLLEPNEPWWSGSAMAPSSSSSAAGGAVDQSWSGGGDGRAGFEGRKEGQHDVVAGYDSHATHGASHAGSSSSNLTLASTPADLVAQVPAPIPSSPSEQGTRPQVAAAAAHSSSAALAVAHGAVSGRASSSAAQPQRHHTSHGPRPPASAQQQQSQQQQQPASAHAHGPVQPRPAPAKPAKPLAARKAPRSRKLGPVPAWAGFTATEPTRVMTGGLTATFHARPVDSGKPTYLSDLEPDEQRRRIIRILQDNEENGAFHFALPRSNDAGAVERLLEVTQMVPLVLFSTPAAGQCAFQPLSESPLTADVAAGLYPTLSYFIYLVESFAPNKDVAQAFLRFLKGGGAEQEAARVHQSYSFVVWRDGLAEFERRGGWDGELLRLHSYAGYSRGWDEPTELDVGGPRPYHHFVGPDATVNIHLHQLVLRLINKFNRALPKASAKIEVFVDFMGTAESLADDSPASLNDIMAVEALVAVIREGAMTLGGANATSCGYINYFAQMVSYLSLLPPHIPVSALDDLAGFPSSVISFIKGRSTPGTSIGTAIKVVRSIENKNFDPMAPPKAIVPAQRTHRVARFTLRSIIRADANFQLSSTAYSRLSRQHPSSTAEPHSDLPLYMVEQIDPYRAQVFYPALTHEAYSSHIRRAQLNPPDFLGCIVTSDSVLGGALGHLVASGTQKNVAMLLCAGDQVVRAHFSLSTDATGPVVLRWDRNGGVLEGTTAEGGEIRQGRGAGSRWRWTKADAVKHTLARYGGAGDEAKDERKRRKEEAQQLMETILS